MSIFKGSAVAIITPFKDNKVNLRKTRRIIRMAN